MTAELSTPITEEAEWTFAIRYPNGMLCQHVVVRDRSFFGARAKARQEIADRTDLAVVIVSSPYHLGGYEHRDSGG